MKGRKKEVLLCSKSPLGDTLRVAKGMEVYGLLLWNGTTTMPYDDPSYSAEFFFLLLFLGPFYPFCLVGC